MYYIKIKNKVCNFFLTEKFLNINISYRIQKAEIAFILSISNTLTLTRAVAISFFLKRAEAYNFSEG